MVKETIEGCGTAASTRFFSPSLNRSSRWPTVAAAALLVFCAAVPVQARTPLAEASATSLATPTPAPGRVIALQTYEAASTIGVADTPAWVQPLPAFDPARRLENLESPWEPNAYHSELWETQYDYRDRANPQSWQAIEYRFLNRYAVESYSTIELDFDPSYQTLTLHEVSVERDGQIIDKMQTSRFDLLRDEDDRDQLMYNGRRTLAILLDDIRVDDHLRYSYSISGANPIYDGHMELGVATDSWSPLVQRRVRLLTDPDDPVYTRIRGRIVPTRTSEEEGVRVTELELWEMPETEYETQAPQREQAYGLVVFSDIASWKDVVDWALPLYRLPADRSDTVRLVARDIQENHGERREQIGAALQWVQNEIRYFGIELGTDSHLPASPLETLTRRFGDCKAKTLLLIDLLDEMGIAAAPALVDTEEQLDHPQHPYRLHGFDHVIVHLEHDGKSHFLDPTKSYQRGALGEFHEPDFKKALVVAAGVEGLMSMPAHRSGGYRQVDKKMALEKGGNGAFLAVQTTLAGESAEDIRYDLDYDGRRDTARSYRDYYENWFGELDSRQGTEFIEGEKGALTINENYQVKQLWQSDENVQRYVWLYGDEIIGSLPDLPNEEDDASRVRSVSLNHPEQLVERWSVKMPKARFVDDLDAELLTPWFHFTKQHSKSDDGRRVVVTMSYRALASEVSAEALPKLREELAKVGDLAAFYLADEPPRVNSGVAKFLNDVSNELAARRQDSSLSD